MAGGLVDLGERIVAAGVEQQDAHLARHRRQCVENVIETHRLQRNVGFPLRIDVDRHQEILAVDLQAVAGVEDEGNGIGTLLRHLGGEVPDLGPQFGLRQIGRGFYVYFATMPVKLLRRCALLVACDLQRGEWKMLFA